MGFLVLENGKYFQGKLFGSKNNVIGEVVFNTSMTGYEEIITDPAYYGQIVAMTYPLIGNYGVNSEDVESSSPKIKGLVVRELCDYPSNWRSERTLEQYLIKHNITGIQGLDTRDLTKTLRDNGVMNGIICNELPTQAELKQMKEYAIKNPVKEVAVKEKYHIKGNEKKKIAVIDLGHKKYILNGLCQMDFDITVFPPLTSADEILSGDFKGLVITDGPGDPIDNADTIKNIGLLLGKLPILGISMGHQLLALALGGRVIKLKYGHRGSNQPIKNLLSGKMSITSQNHGYVVDASSLPDYVKVSWINWNDKTVEGIICDKFKGLGAQFHPVLDDKIDNDGIFNNFAAMMDL